MRCSSGGAHSQTHGQGTQHRQERFVCNHSDSRVDLLCKPWPDVNPNSKRAWTSVRKWFLDVLSIWSDTRVDGVVVCSHLCVPHVHGHHPPPFRTATAKVTSRNGVWTRQALLGPLNVARQWLTASVLSWCPPWCPVEDQCPRPGHPQQHIDPAMRYCLLDRPLTLHQRGKRTHVSEEQFQMNRAKAECYLGWNSLDTCDAGRLHSQGPPRAAALARADPNPHAAPPTGAPAPVLQMPMDPALQAASRPR